MLSSNASKDLQDYFKIKRTCTIPLKIKMLFFILQSTIYPKHHEKLLNKQQVKHFKALLKSLQKQTLQEKAYFLKVNMLFLKDVLSIQKSEQVKLLNESIISTIEAPCNVSETFMKVSYWAKAKFKLNKQAYTIHLLSKRKQLKISLKEYYVRKSRKLKNTLVLESHFDQAGENQKKHVVQFKNSIIFNEVYEHLRQCIIKSTQRQILQLIEPRDIQSQRDLQISKALTLLHTKTMTKYFNEKDKVLNKLAQGKIKFKHLIEFNMCKIQVGKQHGNIFCYKLSRNYSISLKKLQQALNLFNPKQRGNMLCYETIQNFSQHVQLGYFKYFLQNKVFEFLTIFENLHRQKQMTTIIKGVDNMLVAKIIDFIIVSAVQKKQEQITLTVFGKFNFEKMSSKDQENMVNSFLIDLSELVDLNKQVAVSSQTRAFNQLPQENQTEFQEEFYSVRGDVFEQQMDDLNDFSMPFQKSENPFQKSNKNFSDQTFCDLQMPKRQRSQQFDDALIERRSFQSSSSSGNEVNDHSNDSPSGKKQQAEIPTFQSDEKQQEYLTHKWNIYPQQKKENAIFMQQHHLFKSFARHKQGGVYDTDKAVIDQQKKVFKKIVVQLGEKLFKANNSVTNLSLPVQIFKTQTHLKTIARNFTYIPMIVQKAVKQSPLNRMKRVIQAVVAMDGLGLVNQKPFNPALGQTYQGRIDGCPIVLQQISHHPPIGAYHFNGRGFIITGQVQPKISFGIDSLKGYSDRPSKITFNDGMTIQYKQSMMLIGGMIVADRSYNFCGKTYYFDEKNNLFATLNFGPKNFYIFRSNEQYDQVSGQIYRVKQGFIEKFKKQNRKNYPKQQDIVQELAKCQGNWNQYFSWDGIETFNYVKQLPYQLIDEKIYLPSDGRHRSDLQQLILGKMQASQKQKQRIQEQQRFFRKLRQKKKK